MIPPKEEQILKLIKANSSILICLPTKPSTDAIASGLALLSVAEKMGKRARVVAAGFQLPANHSFLPKSDEIFDDLSALHQFIITLDVSKTSVAELAYNIADDKLNIFVSPKNGFFEAKDVTATAGDYAYDLIFTLDSPDLESLGRIYEQNAEFFFHTPIVNIDHNPANNHFGEINLVRITATSTSEIIFELLQAWGQIDTQNAAKILDEYLATHLLTGMISKTKSFQSGSVTPRSLAIASHLIAQGARREEIVKHLYQSKQISTLQLWGRILSKLKANRDHKIVWATLVPADIPSVEKAQKDIPDVIDELIIKTPDARNVFILYALPNGTVQGFVSVARYLNALELFADLSPAGTEHFISFKDTDRSVDDLEKIILSRLQDATKTH